MDSIKIPLMCIKKVKGPEEIIYTSGNITEEETEDPLSKEDFINQIDQISYIQ